jgi:hypothetical protein
MARGLWRPVAVLATAATAVVWFASATPAAAAAAPNPGGGLAGRQAVISDGAQYAKEIKLLDPYVFTSGDGTLRLTPPGSVLKQVHPTHLQVLKSGLAAVNGKILAGELKTTAGHQVYDPTSVGFNIQWNWTGRKWNWWGMSYWFSEHWTLKIEGLAGIGIGVTSLCAVLAAALLQPEVVTLCGIAAAVLTIGVGWMMVADNGGGVVFNTTWTPFPYGAAWIWGQ